jgi:hypothetical protein
LVAFGRLLTLAGASWYPVRVKTLTIPNVPDELYARLEERARRNRLSIQDEILHVLASSPEWSDWEAFYDHSDAPEESEPAR